MVKKIFLLFVSILFVVRLTFPQVAPAGIGDNQGANGQPRLLLWLVADSLNLNNGDNVSNWTDVSGNNISFGPSDGANTALPTFNASAIGGHAAVNFSSGANSYTQTLVHKPFSNFASDKITVFVVMNTTDANSGVLSYNISTGDNEFLLYNPGGLTTFINGTSSNSGVDFRNSATILFTRWKSSGGTLTVEKDGGNTYSSSLKNGYSIAPDGCLSIGGEQDAYDDNYQANQALDGDIAEIIVYDDYLNDAQKTIVDNYLSLKYGIAINDDKFTGNDPAYIYDFRGIGQEANGYQQTGNSAGFIVIGDLGTLDAGDYIMFAHNNAPNSSADIYTGTDLPAGVEAAWNRIWYVEQTGSVNAKIEFDFSQGLSDGKYPVGTSNYVLLYRSGTTGAFSVVKSGADGIEQGDRVYFSLNASQIQNGYYTIGTLDETNSPVEGAAGRNWYTLASGDWDDWQIWTLDPSGALPNNPNHETPSSSPTSTADKVFILTGKTVTVASDNKYNAEITVDGTLDLGTTTGHHFGKINGTGIIRLAADNFPSGDATNFVSKNQGQGKVVYYGGSYNLTTPRTFYDVEIDLDNKTNVLTLLADYDINGDLEIKKGTLLINDNSSTTGLNITVSGNMAVRDNAFIKVGTANARHQLNLYGDLLIQGVSKFTNRTAPDYNNEATDGIVDVNFLSSSQDQILRVEDTAVFYRIEINKGTDATYRVDIDATTPNLFHLYGYAHSGMPNSATVSDNPNALGLIAGTVRLGSNIVIGELTNSGNYNISAPAKLWIDGADVTNTGSAIVPYGELMISRGVLHNTVFNGITLRGNGTIRVTGGTVYTNQIRTSVYGIQHQGSYIQTGGTVNIYGYNPSQSDYYAFTLPFPGNIFAMSGGTLHIYDANGNTATTGGIFINSDPSNVNVTGGTVICEISQTNRPFKITSRAPFWNLILRNTHDNTTDHVLDAGTGVGTTDVDLDAQPLVVLNDLTIEDNAFLNNNNKNISVGRNFYIATGAQLDDLGSSNNNYGLAYETSDTYHLIFNGRESGVFDIHYNADNGYELFVPTVEVNKETDTSRIKLAAGPNKDPNNVSAQWHNRILHVVDTMIVRRGIFDQGRQATRMFGEVFVYKRGQLGYYVHGVTPTTAYVMFRDGDVTVHSEKGAKFGNIKFNTTGTVTFTSDVEITRVGYYTPSTSLYNIGIYNMKIKYLHRKETTNSLNVTDYDKNHMIYTAGNAGDGGISIFIPANSAGKTFGIPLGTNANGRMRYTPVEFTIQNNVNDSGYIQIRPADEVLATTNPSGGTVLSYYWRVSFEGFKNARPDIIWKFYYKQYDTDGANENNWVAGRVQDNYPFNRTYEDDPFADFNSVDQANNIITFDGNSGNGITLDSSCFTAGRRNRFTGTVPVFYTNAWYERWDNPNIWHQGSKTGPTGTVPTEGSVAVIYRDGANQGRVWGDGLDASPTPAMIKFEIDRSVYPDVHTENQPRLQFNSGGTYHLGRVSGPGMISINVANNPTVIGDFGDFARDSCATLMYGWGNHNSYTLSNVITPIPSLMLESKTFIVTVPLEINYDLIFNGGPDVTFTKDVTIGRDFIPGFWLGGTLHFPAHGNPVVVTVKGNIDFSKLLNNDVNNNGTRRIVVDDPGFDTSLVHKLVVYGDINFNNNSNNSIDLFNAKKRPAGELVLAGDTSARLYNASTVPDLYRVIMDKGDDQSLSFTFENNFVVNDTADGPNKPIELRNGTLILNDPNINVPLSTGGEDFYIPSTAALEVRQGRVYVQGDNTGILLDGKLKISGGTVDMATGTGNGNNYIEYSGSGNATIELTSGTFRVGSQVRRGLTSDDGILKYYQSGGTAEFGVKAAPENKRAIFEVLNSGSVFSLTGGSFTIVNDFRSNPQCASFVLDPQTISLANNQTIRFGNSSTVSSANDFTLYAAKPLERLEINNLSGTNPSLTLYNVPLTLNDDLYVDNNAIFDADGYDINIRGYWTNNGTFVANGNKVYFDGADNQQISGNTEFYDLYKNTVNVVSIENASTITVDNLLSLDQGSFDTKQGEIVAKGNVYCNIPVYSSGNSYGVILRGNRQQVLSGNGIFARLMIDNINGVFIPTGYTVKITDSLLMSKGVLDIGKNLLVITKEADIIPINPFSETNMIQTNISFTDAGVKKFFHQISSPVTFTYPIGSNGKYTPVVFNINTFEPDNASVRVKSADERHPSIINDSEAPDPQIPDTANVLQYYWIMDADGVTNFDAKVTMQAVHEDVKFTPPYDSTDYITARLLSRNSGLWDKYTADDFNELTDELYFHFYGTNDDGIDGDYTAGVDGSTFNGAIPDQVPLYITKQDGPWTDTATWTPKPPLGGPKGARVLIKHYVTIPRNYIVSYMTTIDGSGTLDVGTTFGHRLGVVSGTGLLRVARGELPAGDYDYFFAADSGTVEFYGNTDYDILSEIPAVNNLIVSGSGKRNFPNINVQVRGTFTINGATAVNKYDKTIAIARDLIFLSGSFDPGVGTVLFNGTQRQYIKGPGTFTSNNALYDMELNNIYGLQLQTNVDVEHNLTFDAGQIFTSTTNLLTITNTNNNAVTGAGYGKFVDGPLAKAIINGDYFIFPVGDNGRFGKVKVTVPTSVGTTLNWIAQYYDKNPGNDGYDPTSFAAPLQYVSTNEYWRVWSPSSASAKVELRWDNQSGVPSSASDRSNYLEIAHWNFANTRWEQEPANITDNSANGTIETNNNVSFNDDNTLGDLFTLASNYFETFDWVGTADTVWTNAANWSSNKVPGAFNDVTIKSSATYFPAITTNVEVKSLTVESGASLKIYPPGSLTVNNDLLVNGDLILEAPNGVGSYPSLLTNGNVTINGSFKEKLYLTQKKYHYVSSPLQPGGNANSDLYCKYRPGNFNPNFYWYDETTDLDGNPVTGPSGNYDSQYLTNGWKYAHNGSGGSAVNMQVTKGYAFYDESDRLIVYQGMPNNGNIDVTDLSYTDNDPVPEQSSLPNFYDGWHLLGNPYPSYLNWNEVAQSLTNLDNAIYVWDGDQYAAYVNGQTSGSGSLTGDIPPMQGFFVHTTANNGGLSLTNNARKYSTQNFLKKSPAKSGNNNTVKIYLTDGSKKDYLTIYFAHRATEGYDKKYDAVKLFSSTVYNHVPDLFATHKDLDYSIDALPADDMYNSVIPLGYQIKDNMTLTLRFDYVNFDDPVDMYLTDKLLDSTMKVYPGFEYSFATQAGKFKDRFELKFYKEVPPTPKMTIPHLYVYEDSAYDHYFNQKAFVDKNNDKLNVELVDQKGNKINWGYYDDEFNYIHFLADNDLVGDHVLYLRATDQTGLSSEISFRVTVINVNDKPELIHSIPDTAVNIMQEVDLTVAPYFKDVDKNDTLTFSARLTDGSTLPSWLIFDAATGKFSGVAYDPGIYNITVTATDRSGEQVSDDFTLQVKGYTTDVNEMHKDKLAVYPNPASDFVQLYSGYSTPVKVRIYDESGKLIMQRDMVSDHLTLNIRHLPSGKYMVEFDLGDKKITRKLIKN